MLKIYIVEDEVMIGELLRETIASDTNQISLFPCGEELLQKLGEAHETPDIILMDINLPEISGIELTRIIKDKYPDIEIIMQTVNEESEIIISSIEAGASGYLLKTSPREEILMAINIVKEKGSFLTGKIARKVLQKFRSPVTAANGIARFALTAREDEILNEIIKGATNKEIASKYDITAHTVNMHLRKIYQKMQVNSRGEAVARFYT